LKSEIGLYTFMQHSGFITDAHLNGLPARTEGTNMAKILKGDEHYAY